MTLYFNPADLEATKLDAAKESSSVAVASQGRHDHLMTDRLPQMIAPEEQKPRPLTPQPRVPEGWLIERQEGGSILVCSPKLDISVLVDPQAFSDRRIPEETLWALADAMLTAAPPGQQQVEPGPDVVSWAVEKWNSEVANRPLVNVHRRRLDRVWREVIAFAGGNPDELVGPDHDALTAAQQPAEQGEPAKSPPATSGFIQTVPGSFRPNPDMSTEVPGLTKTEAAQYLGQRTAFEAQAQDDLRELGKWLNEDATCPINRQALARVLHRASQLVEEKPVSLSTGHCKEKAKPGGCSLHNLQCGYPSCDRRPTSEQE